MASNVPYLKGVRTRFVNILKKETKVGFDLLATDTELADETELILKVNNCIERLQLYGNKVEYQTEKLAEAVGDSDKELTELLVSENETVCDQATECVLNLKQFQESINVKKMKMVEAKEKYGMEQIVELQKQMNKIVVSQMHQQHEFIEKQEQKEKELETTVKLPKLDMPTFYGDKIKWCEFWDAFENAVHNNKKLSNIEKFNYLKSKVSGEARTAIQGLTLSKENYEVAIGILKERFGNEQEVIDLHYNQMINLYPASNTTSSLRNLLDHMEKHLRSLEVLHQNVNQDVFVSMIRAKLPEEVLLQLEMLNGAKNKWTVHSLRDRLREYITAREHSEKKVNSTDNSTNRNNQPQHENRPMPGPTTRNGKRRFQIQTDRKTTFQPLGHGKQTSSKPFLGSAEALLVNTKQPSVTRYYDQCRYCEQRHWSDECPKYRTVAERKRQLKDSCYKCLKTGHKAKDCKKGKACVHCGKVNDHHRSLCEKKFNSNISSAHLTEEIDELSEGSTCVKENVLGSCGETVLMQTAKTEVKNHNNSKCEQVRILLDCGSQRTYVTESLAAKLKLTRESEEEIKLVTFGSDKPKSVKTTQTRLSIKLNNGQYLDISANIVPVISGSVQRKTLKFCNSQNIEHLVQSLDMADTIPSETESADVELLLGNDYYLDIILSQKIEIRPGLYLLASKLGWILTGRTNECESSVDEVNMLILTYGTNITSTSVCQSIDSITPTKPDLDDFWNIETIGILDNPITTNDEMAKKRFKESLTFKDGRYQVAWPWKEEIPDLPLNKELAVGRLKSNIARMKNKPELMKQYDSIIHDQLAKGVIEKVDTNTNMDTVKHYLPHHAVINPHKPTTKLRVVFDASAKTKKEHNSLNECLYRGPVMLNDLCGLLMRFRLHEIALVADIEKAFLQIGLRPDQRDVTRFVWLKDSVQARVESDNIQEYRFCRVPFGIISSPFLLGATIESHLESYESEIAMKLKNDIYVDNLITGTESVENAIKLYRSAKSIFREASMNLREWISNDCEVNKLIDSVDSVCCDPIKVLGHIWHIDSDSISMTKPNILLQSTNLTKRSILKKIASVFDPLGLCSPVLLKGKVFLQTLWDKHLEWDDAIGNDDLEVWLQISSDVSRLPDVQVKRCIALDRKNGDIKYRLVCFCDASKSAYAAVVYLLQTNMERESRTDLIFSKTRLAPIKKMTIPRLELMAVLIGVRCLRFVKEQLGIHIEGYYLWTDSQCVLSWINSKKDLSVFVKNRVKEIKRNGEIKMNYVSTSENPADVATRGTSVPKLQEDNLWWHGPRWLTEAEKEWPNSVIESDGKTDAQFESEIKKTKTVKETGLLSAQKPCAERTTFNLGKCSPLGIECNKYSSITKLLRVTALALRFINKLRNSNSRGEQLSCLEIEAAEKMWVTHVQRKNFQEVFDAISKGKSNNLQTQLGLYIDEDGLLRCKGRIDQASITESARRPVLLPKNERLTHLMIERTHKQNLHSGVSQCLSQIRHKYWIPHGRATVKSVIQSCLVCRRHEGGPYKLPPMAPLPGKRIREATPFSRTGLDYLGPLHIKTYEGTKKVWVCLFTCLVVRAIHLEVVLDMTTEEFLLALRRFISQRGTPVEIVSDNALTFKSASTALELIWKNIIKDYEIQSYVSNAGIKWSFIVEMAPWMGGFYERLVGLVKRALRKSIHKNLLTLIQLQTILKEVEATVNARPLVYVGDDLESNMALTPRHFLSLNTHTGIPDLERDQNDPDYNPYESSAERLLMSWKKGHKLLNTFWKVWRDEYLLSLRERTQNTVKSGRIKSQMLPNVGDVVLIKDDLPRGCWRLGKIISLVSSLDGEIRSAKVSLCSGRVIARPLNLLYPVEASENCTIEQNKSQIPLSSSLKGPETISRPERATAKRAREKIKQSLSQ